MLRSKTTNLKLRIKTVMNKCTILTCVLFVILCVFIRISHSEAFSSTSQLEDIFNKMRDEKVIFKMHEYMNSVKEITEPIQRLMKDLLEFSYGFFQKDFSMLHPLDAFRFIRNHSVQYEQVLCVLRSELLELNEKDRETLFSLSKDLPVLGQDDIDGAVKGILKIQNTYDLATTDIASGTIAGFPSDKLMADECVDFMVAAYLQHMKSLAKEWQIEALKKIEAGDTTISLTDVFLKAAAASSKVNDEMEVLVLYSYIVYVNPRSRFHRIKLDRYIKSMYKPTRTSDAQWPYVEHTKDATQLEHDLACQGTQQKIEPGQENLGCRYVNNHPLLVIQPLKMETLSWDPFICLYHDFLDGPMLNSLKTQAKPLLKRSTVVSVDGDTTHHERTSKGVFLQTIDLNKKVNMLIEAATDTTSTSYEPIQIANYGIGGQYYIHYDFFDSEHFPDPNFDNRIATFMIYLSDVEAGGATVFPEIGKTIYPKAGKAIFWYNLQPDGSVHLLTLHAACPVLVGDKWVANIWIRRNGQEFTKPCPHLGGT